MDDDVKSVVQKLKSLQPTFDPKMLSHRGQGPSQTLAVDDLNELQQAAQDLQSLGNESSELSGVIEGCNPSRMEELADSSAIEALAEFDFDNCQRETFGEIDRGDDVDINQETATGSAIDKLNDLVDAAEPELKELKQLIDDAVEGLNKV